MEGPDKFASPIPCFVLGGAETMMLTLGLHAAEADFNKWNIT
jgi:hypothetical protein